jgi:hypothetical protein
MNAHLVRTIVQKRVGRSVITERPTLFRSGGENVTRSLFALC